MSLSQSRFAVRSTLLLLLACLTEAHAGEPRPVTDEFAQKLAIITSPEAVKPPEAVDFPPQVARFVRVAILETSSGAQPAIDECEVFGPDGKENLALAERGAVAAASSVLPGYAIHQIKHLNDGRYGNDHSWIAASRESEWVQIELPEPATVARVLITRDRTGKYRDRIPEVYDVLVSQDGQQWQSVAKRDRTAANRARRLPFMPVDRLPEKSWDGFLRYAFLRERATWSDIPADDHLSPLVVDRPAYPGGPPYWGRMARLAPLERVLVLFEEMIERLAGQGLDVSAERGQAAELRRRATDEQTDEQTDRQTNGPNSDAIYLAARRAKRDLFFRDPALAPIERVLFAKRHPYLESHNYSEHLDGILEPGGGVFVLHVPQDEQGRFRPDLAAIEPLFDGGEGIVREPVADYDAETVYFAYRPDKPEVDGWASYWHMYAMAADGSSLRKLTDGPFHDFDAVCLPDGGLAFHTTRCKVRFLCWRPQAYVLYRMEADGSNIRRLSHANLSEWKPSVMRNGRILWTRSEYMDKGADFGHTLWSIRPDGTHPELVFGNNTPNCYSQAHEVPGTNEIVCTLMSHGDHQGPIALIDRDKGPFAVEAITSITPDTRPHYQMSRSHHNTFRDPYPVSQDHFLVTHNPDNQHNWCLYLIDRYGNRELLYVDPEISSKHPTPLRARPRPPVLPSTLDAELAEQGLGQFTVQDVYAGLGSSVARGRAKYLRVAEEVPATLERLPDGQCRADHPPFTDFYAAPTHLVRGPAPTFETRTPNAALTLLKTNHNWPTHVSEVEPGLYRVREGGGWPSYVAKASLGTVPIEEDGSANFLAPAGRVLYFQVLDAEYNELQRMRSVIQLQPGERRGCVGCHEDRHTSPATEMGMALLQPPRSLEPPPWGPGAIDYQAVVQPVFDAHCVGCHNGSEPDRPDLRGALDAARVPISYRTLIEGGWVHYFDFTYGMRHFKAEPLSFGTLRSRLWAALAEKQHKDVSLDESDMQAIKAWIDLNCPLWPDYLYRLDRPDPQENVTATR
ncbi:MAG: discoidin domain-containing protein [Patescibacteria group bacterium]|nr:discoidin domain-containing protein [Patescibacteria group bacterium]